jgi:hypothetical protein
MTCFSDVTAISYDTHEGVNIRYLIHEFPSTICARCVLVSTPKYEYSQWDFEVKAQVTIKVKPKFTCSQAMKDNVAELKQNFTHSYS